MAGSVVQRLEKVQGIFRKKGVWIKNEEAKDETGYSVEPTEPEAVMFCLLGAAKHVGDGQKMLLALARAIDPKFTPAARHADWHGIKPDKFDAKRDCDGCSFDLDEQIEDTITEYNDAASRRLPDIRRVLIKAKKLAANKAT